MICEKCYNNKKGNREYTQCPCQGRIRTFGRDSANAYRGAGRCEISDDYKDKRNWRK